MNRFFLLLIPLIININAQETAYAQLSSIRTQVPPANKSTAAVMEEVDMIHNFELSPNKDRLTAKVGGVYFVVACGQCASVNKTTTGYLDMWYVKNSKPIPNTNCRLSLIRPIITTNITSQFLVSLSPGDTIGTEFSANNPFLGFMFTQPDNEPANTSFFFSIFKVD